MARGPRDQGTEGGERGRVQRRWSSCRTSVPSLAADLRLIGITHPRDLRGQDAFVLYQQLCDATGQRQDPCVLDTFMAVTDFMRGRPPCRGGTTPRSARHCSGRV